MEARGGRTPRRRPAKVAGLVLAAGTGPDGPLALAEADGERVLDRAVRILSLGGADPVLVVLGAAACEVPGADAVVVDGDWASGPGSWLRAGLAAETLAGCGAVLVLPVDEAGARTSAVRRLLAAYDAGAELAVATYAGERGHPVLVGRAHWRRVAGEAEAGGGTLDHLVLHPGDVVEVPCDRAAPDERSEAPPAGRGVLSRIAGDAGSAGAPVAMGLGELGAFLGGAGARAAVDEKASEVVRRQTLEQGADPRTEVDLDAGVARIRPRRE